MEVFSTGFSRLEGIALRLTCWNAGSQGDNQGVVITEYVGFAMGHEKTQVCEARVSLAAMVNVSICLYCFYLGIRRRLDNIEVCPLVLDVVRGAEPDVPIGSERILQVQLKPGEIQTYEDLGLCRYGEGGKFVASGSPFLKDIDYGLSLPTQGELAVNPSGGLLACGHPIGATGLMQAVFAFWQLQGTIEKNLGNNQLQINEAKRGLIHSHAGTGTYITVTILERP